MAVTQFIGPRQAPLWADPVEWNSTRTYEPYTFVTYQGDSYCSRQTVPVGIQITNGTYWVKVSDFNAQATAMQQSVLAQLEQNESDMKTLLTNGENTINTAIVNANTSMNAQVAAVESVKEEFQTQLDQVTTNKNNIATLDNHLSTVYPLDTKPTSNSTKGVTSGGIYNMVMPASLTNYRSLNLVIVGDSWTDGYTESTGTGYVQQLINMNFFKSVTKYSAGGTGWVAGNYRYRTQTQKIISDYSSHPEDLGIVMYVGSVNDLGSSTEAIQEACDECFSLLRNAFPYVRMYAVANVTKAPSLATLSKMETPLREIVKYGGIPLYWPARMLIGAPQGFTSDNYHLIHSAAVYYANNILNNMLGFWAFPSQSGYQHFADDDIVFNDGFSYTNIDLSTWSGLLYVREKVTIVLANIEYSVEADTVPSSLLTVPTKYLLPITAYENFSMPMHGGQYFSIRPTTNDLVRTINLNPEINPNTGVMSTPLYSSTFSHNNSHLFCGYYAVTYDRINLCYEPIYHFQ